MNKSLIYFTIGILLVSSILVLIIRSNNEDIKTEEIISYPQKFVFDKTTILKDYNEEENTIILTNITNESSSKEILTAKLNTPRVNEVYIGYQKVAQFTINPYTNYSSVLQNLELYDINQKMKPIEKAIDIKYLTYEDVLIDDYSCNDFYDSINKSTSQKCIVSGSHIEKKEKWVDWGKNVYFNEEIVIGLFTDVQVGEHIEWIPTLAGVKIDEWAEWYANAIKYTGWENGAVNDTSLTGITWILESGSSANINVNTTAPVLNGSYSLKINGGATRTGLGNRTGEANKFTNNTISIWINSNKTTGDIGYTGLWSGGDRNGTFIGYTFQQSVDCPALRICTYDGGSWEQSAYNYIANTWQRQIIIVNSSGTWFFYNNQSGFVRFVSGVTSIGTWALQSVQGAFDNIAVCQGNDFDCGLETADSLTINLLSPTNNANFTANTNYFVANVTNSTTNLKILNVSLLINGTINQTNTSGIRGIYNFSETRTNGFYNWTIISYGNDSVKYNATNGTLNFTIAPIFELNYTYSKNITELSSTIIQGRFQTGTAISSSFLQYNNTNYSTSIDSLGGNIYILSGTATSPIVSSDKNVTWFFWINNVNTTKFNQTVLNIEVDNCSTYTNYILNYTLADELTQANINNSNSSIESTVLLKTISGEIISQFNKTFTGTPTARICSQTNLTSSGLRIWEQSRYGSTNYVYEANNIQNGSMTSPQNITLLDLPSSSATTFRIIYKSITFLPVPDVIINIQRKYLGEGIYKSIESPITDANGEASANFDLNAVIYKIIVTQNGITLSTFDNPAIVCDNILTGDCSINLNDRQSVNQINNFDIENDFNYGITQNNRTISLVFSIPSGTAKTVNLFVNQSTILGNKTSCNQTIFATNGQIDCTISPTLGDVFTSVSVNINGNHFAGGSANILEDRSQYFGTDNIVLTFFLVLSIILLLVSSPIVMLLGIIIGLVGSSLMLFLNSGAIFGSTAIVMLYIVIVIIILIIKISNREKPIG